MRYLIWSNTHARWWGPNYRGHTTIIEEAGRYTENQARKIVADGSVDGALVEDATDPVTRKRYRRWPEVAVPAPEDDNRPSVITLCGSTAFREQFADVTRQLTMAGHIVIGPGVWGHHDQQFRAMATEQRAAVKETLDLLHLRKIDLADVVFVVNPGGYVGTSTEREIAYALANGIRVVYYDAGGMARRPVDAVDDAMVGGEPCR